MVFSPSHLAGAWRKDTIPLSFWLFCQQHCAVILSDSTKISWSRDLKLDLQRGKIAEFSEDKVRTAIYRPFTKQLVFFDRILNEEVYQIPNYFPTSDSEIENRVICVVNEAQIPFSAQITNRIPCLHYGGRQTQCFPFYTYDEDGSNRWENITDWALAQFQARYEPSPLTPLPLGEGDSDSSSPLPLGEGPGVRVITKWDIFHYVYALLHHPTYRETYAANLRRELPRIPFADDFWAFAQAGARLAELHVNYEQQPEYPLHFVETPGEPLDWRVEKMRLSKDKTQLKYNNFLTLAGLPPEVFEYKLGNRSALDWVIDQYQVSTDARSGIINDPNNPEDEQYIVRLIGQVITVSLETMKIVKGLPALKILD
jgi:predicted helicase